MTTEEEKLIEITDEDFEERLTESFQVGISSGLKRAMEFLAVEAQGAFINNNDEMAKKIREYSQILNKMATEAHPNKKR